MTSKTLFLRPITFKVIAFYKKPKQFTFNNILKTTTYYLRLMPFIPVFLQTDAIIHNYILVIINSEKSPKPMTFLERPIPVNYPDLTIHTIGAAFHLSPSPLTLIFEFGLPG